MDSKGMTTTAASQVALPWEEKMDLVRALCPTATPQEFGIFLHQAKRTGLDPLARQIYLVSRGGKGTIQTGIDGFRLIAERSGAYEGQTKTEWCGEDGCWVDVWLKKEHPCAARVGIHKAGFREPLYAVALWTEYKATGPMWDKMPALMLGKCAEALALRKAFPQDLSGLYTSEEMDQADNTHEKPSVPYTPKAKTEESKPTPKPEPKPAAAPIVDVPFEPEEAGDVSNAERSKMVELGRKIDEAKTIGDIGRIVGEISQSGLPEPIRNGLVDSSNLKLSQIQGTKQTESESPKPEAKPQVGPPYTTLAQVEAAIAAGADPNGMYQDYAKNALKSEGGGNKAKVFAACQAAIKDRKAKGL